MGAVWVKVPLVVLEGSSTFAALLDAEQHPLYKAGCDLSHLCVFEGRSGVECSALDVEATNQLCFEKTETPAIKYFIKKGSAYKSSRFRQGMLTTTAWIAKRV